MSGWTMRVALFLSISIGATLGFWSIFGCAGPATTPSGVGGDTAPGDTAPTDASKSVISITGTVSVGADAAATSPITTPTPGKSVGAKATRPELSCEGFTSEGNVLGAATIDADGHYSLAAPLDSLKPTDAKSTEWRAKFFIKCADASGKYDVRNYCEHKVVEEATSSVTCHATPESTLATLDLLSKSGCQIGASCSMGDVDSSCFMELQKRAYLDASLEKGIGVQDEIAAIKALAIQCMSKLSPADLGFPSSGEMLTAIQNGKLNDEQLSKCGASEALRDKYAGGVADVVSHLRDIFYSNVAGGVGKSASLSSPSKSAESEEGSACALSKSDPNYLEKLVAAHAMADNSEELEIIKKTAGMEETILATLKHYCTDDGCKLEKFRPEVISGILVGCGMDPQACDSKKVKEAVEKVANSGVTGHDSTRSYSIHLGEALKGKKTTPVIAKQDTPRQESPKTETARTGTSKIETVKIEAVKIETPRSGGSKSETVKLESPKSDSSSGVVKKEEVKKEESSIVSRVVNFISGEKKEEKKKEEVKKEEAKQEEIRRDDLRPDIKPVLTEEVKQPDAKQVSAGDTTAPQVASISPAHRDDNVALKAVVSVFFNEDMDPGTITESTLTVKDNNGEKAKGSVSYDSGRRAALFTPTSNYYYLGGYTVTVTTGARDIAGNALGKNFTSFFITTLRPPDAPDFTAGTHEIALSWPALPGAISYDLYWSTNPGVTTKTGKKIAGLSKTNYIHTGLSEGTTYYYILAAVHTGKLETEASPEVKVKTTAWTLSTVDSKSDVGMWNSMAVDANGKLHISYYANREGDLKYATNASGKWELTTVDAAGFVGSATSLKLDDSGHVHISYVDESNRDLKYATNAPSGKWVTRSLDTGRTVDYGSISTLGTSLEIDGMGFIHISYHEDTYGDLMYISNRTNAWVREIADDGGCREYCNDMGRFPSLGRDMSGNIHVAYQHYGPADLMYAVRNFATGKWTAITLDDKIDATDIDLQIDASDKVHIACFDDVDNDLIYKTNASGKWVTSRVDSVGYVGWGAKLGKDPSGVVRWIVYYDNDKGDLKLATWGNGGWVTSTIDATDRDVGLMNAIAIDKDGRIHISYYDRGFGDLKYAVSN